MGIAEVIKEALWYDRESGLNQSEIARKYNLTPQAVGLLFAGKRDFAKLEIATLVKMFPDAEIILNKGICGNAIEAIYPLSSSPSEERIEEFRQNRFTHWDWALLEEWEKLDMQDKCRVMGFIAQLELEKKSNSEATA